jgi:hypothetical protein
MWKQYSSNVFFQKLAQQKGFRRQYGLPTRLISHSQFKKRRKTAVFLRALLEFLRYSAARALREAGPGEVHIVAMDLTRIKSDPSRDPYGAWGFDSRGLFYGYKLGLITSEHGIVLGLTFMKANWTEFRVNRKLLNLAKDAIQLAGESFDVAYLVCDSGFDGETTYKAAQTELGAVALCPPRRKRNPKAKSASKTLCEAKRRTPYRYEAHLLLEDKAIRKIFHKRVEIERVNGQIKDDPLRIHEMPRIRRPVRLLLVQSLGKAILYNMCLIVNAQRNVQLRRIKYVLAA